MASNTYEMTGAVKTIFDTMTFASGFTKREFLLAMEDDYPQDVKFSCVKERAAQLDVLTPGDRVKVAFRVRCREWQGKYFTDLEAFKIDKLEGDGSSVEYEGGGAGFEPADDPTPF